MESEGGEMRPFGVRRARDFGRPAAAIRLGVVSLVGVITFTGCATHDPDQATEPVAGISSSTEPATNSSDNQQLFPAKIVVLDGVEAEQLKGITFNAPSGWKIDAWANVTDATGLAWTSEGDLLVSSPRTGQIVRLHPSPETTQPPSSSPFVTGINSPHSIVSTTTANSSILVVTTADDIRSYSFSGAAVAEPKILVSNPRIAQLTSHAALAISPDGDTISYSVPGMPLDPAARPSFQASLSSFDSTAHTIGVVRQMNLDGANNRVLATGVVDGSALDYAPDETLFAALTSLDSLSSTDTSVSPSFENQSPSSTLARTAPYTVYNGQRFYPADAVTRITANKDWGWPKCTLAVNTPMIQPGQYSDVSLVSAPNPAHDDYASSCADKIEATGVPLPQGTSISALLFLKNTTLPTSLLNGALGVADPRENSTAQPQLLYFPWDPTTNTLTKPYPFLTGLVDENGMPWAEITSLTAGANGKLYAADPLNGIVYRLTPPA